MGIENPEFLNGGWNYSSGELALINEWIAKALAQRGTLSIRKLLFAIKDQMGGRLYLEDIEQIARVESYPFTLVAMPRHTIPNDFHIEDDREYVVWVLEFDPTQARAMDIVSGTLFGKMPDSEDMRELMYVENVQRLNSAGLAEPLAGEVNTFSDN